MGLAVKILATLYGLLLFAMFIVMARKRGIKPFYTTLWLIVSLFMFSFILFESFYQWLSQLLRIESATLFVIVGLISFLFVYVLYLSIKISELSNKVQELISYTAILEKEIRNKEKTQLVNHEDPC
ncbi:MAG TPA: DUF2304 domain-containing protein [Candidatus Cloacimonas acidaminovorans]|jgi:hypothetical protein|nr:DUF2304 domain-containing protein [Candidatus Cloacimonas acidaminovorans]